MYGKNYHHNLYGENSGSLYEKNYHHASQHVSISYCLVIINFHLVATKMLGKSNIFWKLRLFSPFLHMENLFTLLAFSFIYKVTEQAQVFDFTFGLWFDLDPCSIWWPLAGSDFGLRDFSTQPLWPYMANNILFKRCSIVLQNITAAPSSSVQMMLWQWHRQMAMSQMISEI